MPREPSPSPWQLSVAQAEPREDLVGVGADLAPGTLLRAYRNGLFPMGLGHDGGDPIGWWSPDPRRVLLPGDLHVSHSLRRVLPRFEVRLEPGQHPPQRVAHVQVSGQRRPLAYQATHHPDGVRTPWCPSPIGNSPLR